MKLTFDIEFNVGQQVWIVIDTTKQIVKGKIDGATLFLNSKNKLELRGYYIECEDNSKTMFYQQECIFNDFHMALGYAKGIAIRDVMRINKEIIEENKNE